MLPVNCALSIFRLCSCVVEVCGVYSIQCTYLICIICKLKPLVSRVCACVCASAASAHSAWVSVYRMCDVVADRFTQPIFVACFSSLLTVLEVVHYTATLLYVYIEMADVTAWMQLKLKVTVLRTYTVINLHLLTMCKSLRKLAFDLFKSSFSCLHTHTHTRTLQWVVSMCKQ